MILTVENIIKSFGSRKVLRGISFSVETKSITGIVGENGSGKTTFLKILTGILKPTSGSVKLSIVMIVFQTSGTEGCSISNSSHSTV